MPPTKPMLGDIELQLVQKIETEQDQTLTQHEVPALEGDFLQRQGRRASRLTLEGVMAGPEAGEQLKTLRDKFRTAAPVSFVADIATATQVGEVLIEELSTRELAGNPERFAYALTLRERLPPPRPQTDEPPEPETPDLPPDTGTLVIEVVAEGPIDMANVTVTLEGTNADATSFSRVVTNRTGDTWTETGLLPGRFTVRAATQDADPATATGSAQVNAGQTASITLTLRRGAPTATMFLVHFRFDKAFVEPCARAVLRQVAAFAAAADSSQKLVIVGNTDKTGSDAYNQSLSERRARSVYAFLTFGRDPNASFAEWDALRRTRPSSTITTVKDSWGLREAQHMLQDLGDYPGNVDGKDGDLTREAVRAFRCRKGLPPGITINENDNDVWEALIRDYMAQDSFAIPEARFLPNCGGEILKWLGCGEEDPVDRTGNAFRPSRRTELLFVRASSLPCRVPQPDTFNLPGTPPVNNAWCVGPPQPAATGHGCFVSPNLVPGTNNPQPCSTLATGPWCRQPAEPGSITVTGSIRFENNTPAANQPFVLIAPNGEFVNGEVGRGEPTPGFTDGSGNFTFPNKRRGFYYIEVRSRDNQPPLLVRLAELGDETVKGNAVCKALLTNTDSLNVVIVDAPTIREIRLPASARLMTALHPITRAVRTCPQTAGGPPLPQRTRHTEADVRGFFAAANRVWRQARVRLLLADADITGEAYAFRTDCEVDGSEFEIILERCAYPNTVNFFFFGDLSGSSEAGFHVISPIAGPRVSVEGCAITDRFLFAIFTPPADVNLSAGQTEQVMAHEFGHFLSLAANNNHVASTPANRNRLMLPGTGDGSNRTLVRAEISQARASNNAGLDCLPLTLNVTGATRIGGARSHEFVVLQNASGVVTIDAVINPRLLDPAAGSLAISGGLPGANPQQRTVSAAAAGPPVEIVATYTPARGGNPVITYVSIHVVTFRLRVEGACQLGGPGGDTFVVVQSTDPNAVVTIIADVAPQPFCVPRNLVNWTAGVEAPDPLRRTVSAATAGTTPVSATVAGTTRSVTLLVVTFSLRVERPATPLGDATVVAVVNPLPSPVPPDLVTWQGGTPNADPLRRTVRRNDATAMPVRARICLTTMVITGALVTNTAPFNTPVALVQIEGVLNTKFPLFDTTDLIGTQSNSLFRARAEIPGIIGNTLAVELVSLLGGTETDRVTINLTRTTGDVFVSGPVLVIPSVLPRATITTVGLDLVGARAGGILRLQTNAALGAMVLAQTQVRGRVVNIFAQGFTGSGVTVAVIQGLIDRANRVWAQAGLEVKARSITINVTPPAGLLDLDTFASRNPFLGVLSAEEQVLLNITPGSTITRSPTANDMNIYFVQVLIDPNPALPNPGLGAVAYATESYAAATEPDHSAIALEGTGLSTPFLGHELGHHLLRGWGGDEHSDQSAPQVPWPNTNVMSATIFEVSLGVDRLQVQNILNGTAANTHPVIRFEP